MGSRSIVVRMVVSAGIDMTWKVGRQLILVGLVTAQTLLILQLRYRLIKAETCNVVFVRYLREIHGLRVNLDSIYKDGKKWVRDPHYSTESSH